jgi:hypothetical protein
LFCLEFYNCSIFKFVHFDTRQHKLTDIRTNTAAIVLEIVKHITKVYVIKNHCNEKIKLKLEMAQSGNIKTTPRSFITNTYRVEQKYQILAVTF